MKSASDPRHKKRIQCIKELFSLDFASQQTSSLSKEVFSHKEKIDKLIEGAAPQWPLDKLNHIDLAILRLAVFEITNTDTPHKVAIDEAIELAKEFGGENSPSFVNGVLGKIVSDLDPSPKNKQSKEQKKDKSDE
jgi:transcription antitermination factor NusB